MTEKIRVITTDSRIFEGRLEGFDNSTNIVISNCIERLIYEKEDDENKELQLGLYMMRGGNIVCIGEVTGDIEWAKVKGEPLKSTKRTL